MILSGLVIKKRRILQFPMIPFPEIIRLMFFRYLKHIISPPRGCEVNPILCTFVICEVNFVTLHLTTIMICLLKKGAAPVETQTFLLVLVDQTWLLYDILIGSHVF